MIGARTLILPFVFVGHDLQCEPDVTVAAHASIGGLVGIDEGASIGMAATIYPRVRVGAYAMIGTHASVVEACRAFGVFLGAPAKFQKVNSHAFERAGISDIERLQVLQIWAYGDVELTARLQRWFHPLAPIETTR
jgi:acyl-[acyl carrier protein]--UDP-N-acetylglucosamine O-acyltransferase